jgi:hypothetical protein
MFNTKVMSMKEDNKQPSKLPEKKEQLSTKEIEKHMGINKPTLLNFCRRFFVWEVFILRMGADYSWMERFERKSGIHP